MWQQILAEGVSQYVYVGSELGKNSDVIVERPKSFFFVAYRKEECNGKKYNLHNLNSPVFTCNSH